MLQVHHEGHAVVSVGIAREGGARLLPPPRPRPLGHAGEERLIMSEVEHVEDGVVSASWIVIRSRSFATSYREMRTLLEADILRVDPVMATPLPRTRTRSPRTLEKSPRADREPVPRDQERGARFRERPTQGPEPRAWSLDPKDLDPWLTCLQDMRLAIGTRLEIDEPRMGAPLDPKETDAAALSVLPLARMAARRRRWKRWRHKRRADMAGLRVRTRRRAVEAATGHADARLRTTSRPGRDVEALRPSGQEGRVVLLSRATTPPVRQREACDFPRHRTSTGNEAGYVILGISPQGVESKRAFKTKYDLNFPLLADVGMDIQELRRHPRTRRPVLAGHPTQDGRAAPSSSTSRATSWKTPLYGVARRGHVRRPPRNPRRLSRSAAWTCRAHAPLCVVHLVEL